MPDNIGHRYIGRYLTSNIGIDFKKVILVGLCLKVVFASEKRLWKRGDDDVI